MKKIMLLAFSLLLLLSICPLNTDFSLAQVNQIIINTDFSYLYKNPLYEDHFDFKINKNSLLDYTGSENNFYIVSYTFEDINYNGYIPIEFASPYVPPQETILVYNGKIIKTTSVYSISEDSLMEDIKLQSNQNIYIYEGFNSKNEFTKIKFMYNNEVITGKVLTIDLSPNGVSKTLIISLSIIAALVGVILILFGLSKKKRHKLLQLNKK